MSLGKTVVWFFYFMIANFVILFFGLSDTGHSIFGYGLSAGSYAGAHGMIRPSDSDVAVAMGKLALLPAFIFVGLLAFITYKYRQTLTSWPPALSVVIVYPIVAIIFYLIFFNS